MKPASSCPICGKRLGGDVQDAAEAPFCSRRCRDIDLGRWLGERYRVPAAEPPDDFADPDDPERPT